MLVDRESDTLFQQAALLDMKPVEKERTVALGRGLAGYVAEKGKPVVVPDVLQDGRWDKETSDFNGMEVSSVACAPVKVGNDTIGYHRAWSIDLSALSGPIGTLSLVSCQGYSHPS